MSDGPHKSLPLQRRWQDLAERAANRAFSDAEVSEAMRVAARKEFGGLPIEKLRDAMRADDQASLFTDAVEGDLDALRLACLGNASWNGLIDCSINQVRRGGGGEVALSIACEAAVDLKLRAVSRQIEEHYLRKEGNRSAFPMRQRLANAQKAINTAGIASEICGAASRSPSNARILKQGGLDQGVSL